ncbi:F-box only protein 30 [Tachyglossus aculeatus]|uniref:F-box only protein 30 n=1 Tax=Tachyglossus aculeatus TaxID=9261 RepID=UPI0018F3DFA1|nr:F-box only protein 30 [Tachyglossus aculeatus]XP_038624300.1 F-box only protein 30 [Tachyglossus aculeatus]XP_038624307.1 F-box only protein 30 [Tachyglossus aculeatus]XP_038624315.1 F-box only protein 30 [Tachyglossus aculeatus]XP_038624322.1 F-box only protein 30 [Tachyglossus aculeatus]
MEEDQQHAHCINCVSRRCMTRPETGISCDLIGCPLVCGAVFHSCKADEHRSLCPLERVPCLNSGFGCPFTIARNKVAEHLEACPASVVCCTMEWNRWPVSYADRKSYENLSRDVDEVEQLDMALALQDQRMLLESLKVATMMSNTTDKVSESREQSSVKSSVPDIPHANGLVSVDEESYGALYQATVETTRSLAAALDILNTATRDIGMLNTRLCATPGEIDEEQEATESFESRNSKDHKYPDEDDMGAVGGIDHSVLNPSFQGGPNSCSDSNTSFDSTTALCNGSYVENRCSEVMDQNEGSSIHEAEPPSVANGECMSSEEGTSKSFSSLPRAPQLKDAVPSSPLPNGRVQRILLPEDRNEEEMLEKKVEQEGLRNLDVLSLLRRQPLKFLSNPGWFKDKAVDTSDLEIAEDPMGLQGIDLITAALLFCLGDSPGGRGISDSRVVDGYHIDFGTQTFSLPSAILATNTMVGEIASASACDHANPQLSNPSPFQTLGLDLVLEYVARYQTKQRSMFTFVCGQLFRRKEFSSHFKNVHGDIHAGLNGWMEQRCPLAYYGCTYSQRRFCPSTQGAKIIHDRHLRSFGVQPCVSTVLAEPARNCLLGLHGDHLSSLPFEVLQHIAGFLDGFSLCQLSCVSRLMRDVCGSLLQSRGMVILLWEKRKYPNGTSSWQIKEKVWRFSTAFCSVNEWKFADIMSMADHLKKCSYNVIERREEAVPLPCMCVTRELTKEGRSLRSVLKPVL